MSRISIDDHDREELARDLEKAVVDAIEGVFLVRGITFEYSADLAEKIVAMLRDDLA